MSELRRYEATLVHKCGENPYMVMASADDGDYCEYQQAADEITRLRQLLSETEKREREARAKAIEEAALWHDAKVQEYTNQIAVNDAYLARSGRLSSESQANEYCDDQRSTHRRSAAHLRSMAGRAALERSEG